MNAKSTRRTRKSVADQYKPQDLGSLLTPSAEPEPAPANEQATQAATRAPKQQPAAEKATQPAAPTPARRRRGRPKKTESVGATAPVNLRLPVSLLNAIEDVQDATGKSYITIVLEAVLAQRDRLAELVIDDNQRRAQIKERAEADNDLFVFSLQRGPRPIYDEPTEIRLWRTYQRNVDVLNQLVETSGAQDRNQLLLVALRAHLEETG